MIYDIYENCNISVIFKGWKKLKQEEKSSKEIIRISQEMFNTSLMTHT